MTPSRLRIELLRAAKLAARNPALVAFIVSHLSFALPVERLNETASLLAFRHPTPAYPFHILIIPKKPLAGLADINPADDALFLADLYMTVQKLVAQFDHEADGYRLVVNGGSYQEFPFLHFHLISEHAAPESPVTHPTGR
jgi:histidine triad (HIT) family protein